MFVTVSLLRFMFTDFKSENNILVNQQAGKTTNSSCRTQSWPSKSLWKLCVGQTRMFTLPSHTRLGCYFKQHSLLVSIIYGSRNSRLTVWWTICQYCMEGLASPWDSAWEVWRETQVSQCTIQWRLGRSPAWPRRRDGRLARRPSLTLLPRSFLLTLRLLLWQL